MSLFTQRISNTSSLQILNNDAPASFKINKKNEVTKESRIKELPGSGIVYPSMSKVKCSEQKPKHRGINLKHKITYSKSKKKSSLLSSGVMNPQRQRMNQSCIIAQEDIYIIPDSDKSFYIDLKDKESSHIVVVKSGKKGRIDGNDNTFVIIEDGRNRSIDFYLFHLEPEDSIPNIDNNFYRETGGLLFDENRAQYIVRWIEMEKDPLEINNPFLSSKNIVSEDNIDLGTLQIEGGPKKIHIQTMSASDISNLLFKLNLVDSFKMLDLNEVNIDYLESLMPHEIFSQDRINLAIENLKKYDNK